MGTARTLFWFLPPVILKASSVTSFTVMSHSSSIGIAEYAASIVSGSSGDVASNELPRIVH